MAERGGARVCCSRHIGSSGARLRLGMGSRGSRGEASSMAGICPVGRGGGRIQSLMGGEEWEKLKLVVGLRAQKNSIWSLGLVPHIYVTRALF